MIARLTRILDLALQIFTIALIVVLACVVLLGVVFRYSGNSLIWYDEVAAVLITQVDYRSGRMHDMAAMTAKVVSAQR